MLPAMQEEAEKLYKANKEKSAAATKERKAQKELDILMADAWEGEKGSFEHSFQYNDVSVTIEAKYEQKARDAIDVTKLYDLTDLETFLSIVTASKAAVERACGKNIANMCVSSKLGDWKSFVRERK
jgi:hypothetical protein